MKKFLTKRYFGGKVPAWAIIVAVLVLAYIVKKRQAAQAATNPAASANQDQSQPFPYSSPDMFPTQGPAGPQGPVGPAGPRGPSGIKPAAPKKPLSKHQQHLAHLHHLHVLHQQHEAHIGNRPAYNKRIGAK